MYKGVHLNATNFKYFPVGISVRNLHHICIHLREPKIRKKKSKKVPSNEYLFRENSHVTKIWKIPFPKNFFNKNWLKVGEHEYIYIPEIKFGKNCSVYKIWRPKQFLSHCAIMLIVLIRVKMAQPISLFHQKMCNWYLGNYKKRGIKLSSRFNRRREKQNVGSKWTSLLHLSGNEDEAHPFCC